MLFILLPLLRAHTVGYSSGGGESGTGQWCDAMTLCEHGAGHYGQATCPHGMHLVRQPEKSATYSVRAGDGTSASADPTAYAPGELVEIHVRTTSAWIQGRRSTGGIGLPQCYASLHSTDFGQCTGAANEYAMLESSKFIGLLLYAVDANEAKVGGWEISPAIPQRFWTPPDAGCAGKALMHKDPSPKNYHHVFHFRAPAAGAGALTFRALVKQGDTNGGAFYWPVAPAMSNSGTKGVDLVLTEGVSSSQQWYRSAVPGAPCDAVCAAQAGGQTCNAIALAAGDSSSASGLASVIAKRYLCNTPLLGTCDAIAAPFFSTASAGEFCTFRDTDATRCPGNSAATPQTCASSAGDSALSFCPCNARRLRRRLGSDADVAGDDSAGGVNAGARTATPPSTALLLAGAALTQLLGGGAALPLLTLTTAALALLPVADAHNWVTMPSSRASEASSVKPCRARLSAKPNVQINPGGEFFVEHTAGHQTGPSHAWTLVRVEDEDKLGLLTGSNIFSEYLSEANDPSSKPHAEGDYIAAAKYEKLHWSTMGANPGQGTGPTDATHESWGRVKVQPNDERFFVRPHSFACDIQGNANGFRDKSQGTSAGKTCVSFPMTLWKYPAEQLASDRRAAYVNAKYPWIISIQAQRVCCTATQVDTVRMTVPASLGTGQFIAHYHWAGYNDCVDINVIPTSTGIVDPDPMKFEKYGYEVAETTYSRIDHCQYKRRSLEDVKLGTTGLPPLRQTCADPTICNSDTGPHYSPWDSALSNLAVGSPGGCTGWECCKQRCVDTSGCIGWTMQAGGNCRLSAAGATFGGARGDIIMSGPVACGLAEEVKHRTCFAIPPIGKTNADGFTATEALAQCQARCENLGSGIGANTHNRRACQAINVVPLTTPALVKYPGGWSPGDATQPIRQGDPTSTPQDGPNLPWGVGNCEKSCFANEPAGTKICYPLRIFGNTQVEEDWTVIADDVTDEVFYSTCYRRVQVRMFDGPECAESDCPFPTFNRWRFDGKCISCADAAFNAQQGVTPTWTIADEDSCRACADEFSGGSGGGSGGGGGPPPASGAIAKWCVEKATSGAGNPDTDASVCGDAAVTLEWSRWSAAADSATAFTLTCDGCGTDGWVAIGISDAATMPGTNALRWNLADGTVSEVNIDARSSVGVKTLTSSTNLLSVKVEGSSKLHFSARMIATKDVATSGDQQWVFAYSSTAGVDGYHGATQRGAMMLDFDARVGSASQGNVDDSGEQSSALGLTLGLLFTSFGLCIALVATVAIVIGVILFIRNRKKEIKAKRRETRGVRGGAGLAMGGIGMAKRDSLASAAAQAAHEASTRLDRRYSGGVLYEKHEFIELYGNLDRWHAARRETTANPLAAGPPPKPPRPTPHRQSGI